MLSERYPDLSFLLTIGQHQKLPPHTDDAAEWRKTLELEGIDTLYLYGIGLQHYLAVKEWLHEKRERLLILLEDDLAAIEAAVETPGAQEWIDDPQVHLEYFPDKKRWRHTFERIAEELPSDRIVFTAIPAYVTHNPAKIRKMRLFLMRKCGAVHAKLTEAILSYKLFDNLAPNFRRLPQAFLANALRGKFAGVPAIICGAGPSLAASIPQLKELEHKALIIAGGSSIAALTSRGIQPHLSMALDPNAEEFGRLKASHAFEVPLLYGNRLLPHVFATTNGPMGYIRSHTGGPAEFWVEQRLGIDAEAIGPELGPEAMSVTTLAVALAYEMGCNPIIFTGVDLAYTGMQRYASGVLERSDVTVTGLKQEKKSTERMLRRKDRKGNWVYTLVKWIMESSAINSYAKNHPKTRFINATEGGIGFADIPYRPLTDIVQTDCLKSFDLRGMIHSEIQRTRLETTPERIQELFQEMKESAERCLKLSDEMLSELKSVQANSSRPLETGKMVIIESDFEQEVAFDCLLQTLGPAMDRIMQRRLLHIKDPDSETFRKATLEKSIAKWQQYQTALRKLCSPQS
jgi:hypothetical protein